MTQSSSKIPYLPESLQGLADIALNFSWRWNRFARELFWEIDPTLYQLSGRNPIELLRRVDPAQLASLARDPEFLEKYSKVMATAEQEGSTAYTWFTDNFGDDPNQVVAQRRERSVDVGRAVAGNDGVLHVHRA